MAGSRRTRTGPPALTRRRLIAISAASMAMALPGIALAQARQVTWRGIALGARAKIQLVHADEVLAGEVLQQCVREIDRLEDLFSLYRTGSTLNALNRAGEISNPDLAFLELIAAALQVSRETGGAFDISVQPLWQLYADHFATPGANPAGPAPELIGHALELVDYRQIKASPQRIALGHPGMAVTLNGIAQGFITDRISALLNANGFSRVLVHLGESYGSGTRADGSPWRAGIAAPDGSGSLVKTVGLSDRALATSGGYGHKFDAGGKHHHLFDPRSGLSASRYGSVSVAGPSSMMADALSTAFSIMPLDRIREIIARQADMQATIVQPDGTLIEL